MFKPQSGTNLMICNDWFLQTETKFLQKYPPIKRTLTQFLNVNALKTYAVFFELSGHPQCNYFKKIHRVSKSVKK